MSIIAALFFLVIDNAVPYRVGGEVKAPVAIKRAEPDLSRCHGKHGEGFSILEAVIDKTGRPRDIKIRHAGVKCVDDATVVALRQWRFKPGTLNGKPVAVIFNFTAMPHFR